MSLAQSCEGEGAQIEGSYRFIRNERFTVAQIATFYFGYLYRFLNQVHHHLYLLYF